MTFNLKTALVMACSVLGSWQPAVAQTYPGSPIHLVLPYSPGGIIDFAGRGLGQQLSQVLGQTVVPENRPGAGGIAGTDLVARANPDGYTLLFMDPAIVINPSLQASVPYDLFKQLKAVSIVSSSPEVLVIAPDLKVNSVAELIEYGKKNPGKLNFASAGVGTTPHLAGELLKMRTGISASHVPYRSIGESFPDLISNRVQFAFSSIAGAMPFTSSNQVRTLATTGVVRSPVFPDKQTVAEAGVEGFEVDLWLGVFAPSGVPKPILDKLNGAIRQALANEDLKAAFLKSGITTRGASLEDSDAMVRSEFAKWQKVIETSGAKGQ